MQIQQQFLSPLEFKFFLQRLPTTNFFVQSVSLPSLSLSSIVQPTPFYATHITGNTLEFGELSVTFKVDEDMVNYRELFDWMVGLGFPRKFDEYKNLKESDFSLYSDGSLIILSSQKNSNILFKFTNMFPVSLDSIQLDITQEDVIYTDCTVTFRYDTFTIERLRAD